MQNNINNTNQPDTFSESIRKKLENHSLPLDPNGWNNLQAKLNAVNHKKIIPFWFWFSGGAAVAALALLFVLRPFSEPYKLVGKSSTPQQEIKNDTTPPADTLDEVLNTNHKVIELANAAIQKLPKKIKLIIVSKQIQPTKSTSKVQTPSQETTIILANKIEENGLIALNEKKKTEEVTENSPEIATTKTEESDINRTTPAKRILPNSLLNEPEKEEPTEKKKIKNELLLAAAFGSGGSSSLSGGTSNEFLALNVSKRQLSKAETDYTSLLSPNDFSQQTFLAPLSFGLVLRKNIGSSIGIETGLVYTYLLSTFEEHSNSNYDAQLTLHYLGIPLNLIVPLWKSKQWEVYLSGGGMVEKGLRSIFIQNQYFGNQVITNDERKNIEGLQWSTNAALGITYKIQRNIGIYFEPKFSYFFENNQPISARTDQPIVIGLTAGLRYKF